MKEVKDRKDYEENLSELIELLENFRDSVSFLARDNRLLKKNVICINLCMKILLD